jgi:hypothetical protein
MMTAASCRQRYIERLPAVQTGYLASYPPIPSYAPEFSQVMQIALRGRKAFGIAVSGLQEGNRYACPPQRLHSLRRALREVRFAALHLAPDLQNLRLQPRNAALRAPLPLRMLQKCLQKSECLVRTLRRLTISLCVSAMICVPLAPPLVVRHCHRIVNAGEPLGFEREWWCCSDRERIRPDQYGSKPGHFEGVPIPSSQRTPALKSNAYAPCWLGTLSLTRALPRCVRRQQCKRRIRRQHPSRSRRLGFHHTGDLLCPCAAPISNTRRR